MRNPDLLAKRNEQIFTRYGEMYFGQLMRDEEIYKVLVIEFHLEKRTLYGIILDMSKQQNLEVV